jgi:hypothetical protein
VRIYVGLNKAEEEELDGQEDPHETFHDDDSYAHLAARIQNIAQDWLNLEEKETRFNYQLFVQQETEKALAREQMKPVFSVSFGPNKRGTEMVEKARFLDEGFLYCKETDGCWKCKPAEK